MLIPVKRNKRALAMLLALSLLICFSGYGSIGCVAIPDQEKGNTDFNESDNNPADVQDAMVEIKVKPIQVNGINVKEIDPKEIVVNPILVKEIKTIEIEPVTINDEFVYLAYQNFVSYYEEDIDVAKLLKDFAVGSSVILVWFTLSTVGGPVGTFFGAVITSEFTASINVFK